MTWLKRILIDLGIVLVLLIAILFALGFWTPDENSIAQTRSMTVGNRTVTVSGQYKNMTQDSLADGIKIAVDGHEVTVGADQLTVDGNTQVLEPDQDVEVLVDAKGAVSVKVVRSGAGGAAHAPQ
jgi:autotransporter translocation and assembly factor TamB